MTSQSFLLRTVSPLPDELARALDPYPLQSCGPREWRLALSTSEVPSVRRNLFEKARALALDLLFAPEPAVASPPRWMFFDGDATLLAGETIDELARVAGTARMAGTHERVAAITARAMAGEIDFATALRERVALLKGMPVSELDDVAAAMPLSPGAEETVRTLKARGIAVGVLSGGFHFLLDRLEDRLGLDYVAGNRLAIENGRLTGEVTGTIVDAARKARLLRRALDDRGLAPADAVAVGDGANDIPMLEAAGLGLAYRAKPALVEVADGVLFGGGLDAVLDLLNLR